MSATHVQGPLTFQSERYGYVFDLPAGWYVHGEGAGTWTPWEINYIGAGTDAFEEDYEGRGDIANFPGITYGFYVSAAELSTPIDVEA
jgi:hypothetical protein